MHTLGVVLAVYSVLLGIQCCPNNSWHQYNGNCYLLKNDARVTWFNAVQECIQLGGWLVDVTIAEEDTFLKNTIRNQHSVDNPQTIGYWINANDLANEGTWVLGFPSTDIIQYNDWFPGEPNNVWYDHRAENCVALWGHDNHNYQWNDQPCDNKDYFICKTEDADAIPVG